jgi:hypothetical protein
VERSQQAGAKVHLPAPQEIVDRHALAADRLEQWSALPVKAMPRRMQVGDKTVEILQAPDPAAAYKEPAKQAFNSMQEQVQKLNPFMRAGLQGERTPNRK